MTSDWFQFKQKSWIVKESCGEASLTVTRENGADGEAGGDILLKSWLEIGVLKSTQNLNCQQKCSLYFKIINQFFAVVFPLYEDDQ